MFVCINYMSVMWDSLIPISSEADTDVKESKQMHLGVSFSWLRQSEPDMATLCFCFVMERREVG